MSQKPLSDFMAEATGGKESTSDPSQSSTAPAALPTIQENTSAHEESLQTGAPVTALSTNLGESPQEQPSQEAVVSEIHSTEGQATESGENTTQLPAGNQLEEVYQQQSDAAALIDQSLVVDLPTSSLVGHALSPFRDTDQGQDYDQLHTAPSPAVEPQVSLSPRAFPVHCH